MTLNEILNRLKGVKRLGEDCYQVQCPCHDDKRASLTVTRRGDKILMHCHAGCDTRDIVSALGIEMRDLSEEETRTVSWKDKINDLEAVYDYGEYVKLRLTGKRILYGHIVNGKFVKGMPDVERTLYGLEIIKKAIKNNKTIYIVEGEKDADNMNKKGLPCCTAGGVKHWQSKFCKHFKGANVVILPDNDEPGQNLAKRIKYDIIESAFSVKIVTVSNKEKGDVSDFFADGKSKNDLLDLVENEKDIYYAPWVITGGKNLKINAGILADCVSRSLKYIILKKSGIDVADFYVYENGVYAQKSRIEFKGYIKEYIPRAYQSDTLLNNVANLLLSSNDNSFDYEDANNEENIINFKNGLYRIKQDELIKHTEEKISTIQLSCNYNPHAKCPKWLSYIDTLCSDGEDNVDEEKKAVLQEWFGLLISNVKVWRTKKCLALHSSLGDTGKSKYLDMLAYIIGDDNVAHVPIQNMSDRFSMGNLYGKRLNSVGDQKSTDIEDSSVFKQLTGGDPLGVEMKGKTAFQFRFKGGFAFACNDLPCFKDDKGGHVFERFTIIECSRYLRPEERDKSLTDKLLAEKDGIAAWAIEGLKRLQKNNFNFTSCSSSDRAVNEYRGNVDTFYKFIAENYEITLNRSDRVPKKELEQRYSKWCSDNEYSEIKKKNIKDRAAKSGIEMGKFQGDWYYKGLREIFYQVQEDGQLPQEWVQQKFTRG